MRRKARRLVADAATLSMGAYVAGSLPAVPGHSLNVMPGFSLASVGLTTRGAGMALDSLGQLGRVRSPRRRRR